MNQLNVQHNSRADIAPRGNGLRGRLADVPRGRFPMPPLGLPPSMPMPPFQYFPWDFANHAYGPPVPPVHHVGRYPIPGPLPGPHRRVREHSERAPRPSPYTQYSKNRTLVRKFAAQLNEATSGGSDNLRLTSVDVSTLPRDVRAVLKSVLDRSGQGAGGQKHIIVGVVEEDTPTHHQHNHQARSSGSRTAPARYNVSPDDDIVVSESSKADHRPQQSTHYRRESFAPSPSPHEEPATTLKRRAESPAARKDKSKQHKGWREPLSSLQEAQVKEDKLRRIQQSGVNRRVHRARVEAKFTKKYSTSTSTTSMFDAQASALAMMLDNVQIGVGDKVSISEVVEVTERTLVNVEKPHEKGSQNKPVTVCAAAAIKGEEENIDLNTAVIPAVLFNPQNGGVSPSALVNQVEITEGSMTPKDVIPVRSTLFDAGVDRCERDTPPQ